MIDDAAAAERGQQPAGWWIAWATAVITAVWLSVARSGDFLIYWRAGHALITGGWTAAYEISVTTPFKYHPAFAVAFLPFGWLPVQVAKGLWALLNAAAAFDAQRRWSKHWRIDAIAIGLGYICVGHALFWHYQLGNVDFIMLWLWTVAITTPRPWVEAVCYGILIALKPFWLALLLAWVLARRWRLMGRVVVAIGGLSLVPLLLGPASFLVGYQRWIATFADPLHSHNYPAHDNQTWYALLYRHIDVLGHLGVTLWWLAGSGVVALVWLWYWRQYIRALPPQAEWWRMEMSLIPFILWTAPLSWIHHQVLLWPLLACVWQVGRREWQSRLTFVVTFVLLTVLSESIVGRQITHWVWDYGVELIAFLLLAWWSGSHFGQGRNSGDVIAAGH